MSAQRTRSRARPSAGVAARKRSPAVTGYAEWLADVKARIHAAQQRAVLAVNRELLTLYWQLGRDILERQAAGAWGDGILDQVSADLRAAFPGMKGFSRSNLKYMRAFAEAWPTDDLGQQAVGQLPWGHNLVLLTKLKDRKARLAYAARAVEHGWSRAVLVHHIEARTVDRQGRALTNFAERLPKAQSDLARESLKDPYRFDFLGIGDEASELELEGALVQHITRFLLELGAGFAFVGRQVHLEVGGEDFFLDLLFYHHHDAHAPCSVDTWSAVAGALRRLHRRASRRTHLAHITRCSSISPAPWSRRRTGACSTKARPPPW